MQATFNNKKEPVFFSIPSLRSNPLELRSLDKFDKSSLIPHIRCKNYSQEQTIEKANLAKEMGFKKIFLVSGDTPYPHQNGLTSCQAIPYYHRLDLEVGSSLDIYAPCLRTEIEKALEKIKSGASYLVTQVVFFSNETEKRLLKIQHALQDTGVKIYPCLSLLGDFEKDRHLLKKICPSLPQEIFSGKQKIENNNKKAVDIFQRLFNSDTTYLFQVKTS
ncbi:MAG TPA: hypothetical protein DD412_03960 [Holosporales bacterium]|nr:hypothetical protein [Holosporales bacterium]